MVRRDQRVFSELWEEQSWTQDFFPRGPVGEPPRPQISPHSKLADWICRGRPSRELPVGILALSS